MGKKRKEDIYLINKNATNYKSSNGGPKSLGKNYNHSNNYTTKSGLNKNKQYSQGKNSQKYR